MKKSELKEIIRQEIQEAKPLKDQFMSKGLDSWVVMALKDIEKGMEGLLDTAKESKDPNFKKFHKQFDKAVDDLGAYMDKHYDGWDYR